MENLIFDIGFHKGEDTLFYLLKGYRVIAVDADPDLINEWQNIFKKYIENGKLLLLNYVISDTNDVDTDFISVQIPFGVQLKFLFLQECAARLLKRRLNQNGWTICFMNTVLLFIVK